MRLVQKVLEILGNDQLTLYEINNRIIDSGYQFIESDTPVYAYISQAMHHLLSHRIVERIDGKYRKRMPI